MQTERVLVLGGTGLVGAEVLRKVQKLSGVREIFVLTRRPLSLEVKDDRLKNRVVDFSHLDEQADYLSVDTVICAMGTTIKKAGSQEEFRKVDYDIPLTIARLAKAKGAKQFLLVSSLGADANSKIFYSRTKGELERDLGKLNFSKLVIVRPSILFGDRSEVRIAEKIGQQFSKILPPKWRGVSAERVAEALVHSAGQPGTGVTIIENREILA